VIAISALSLVAPLLSKQVVDIIVSKVQGHQVDITRIFWLLGAIIAADILITCLTAFGQWLGDILGVRLQTYLSQTFYKHILGLHIGYYDNEITGKIVNKMYRGIQTITDFIQSMLNNFLPFFLTAAVTIVLLSRFSLFIGVLLAALFPLYIFISHGSTMAWRKYEDQKNKINDLSQGRVFESISGIRIVKSFAAELNEWKSFLTARHQIEGLAIQQTKEWHVYDFIRRLMLNVILFLIYAYIVYWTFYGRFTLGEMTLLLQLVNQARFPLFAMSFILGQIQQASAGSKDFFAVLNTKTEVVDAPDATQLVIPERIKTKNPAHLIQFQNVSFDYEPGKPVLKNISFGIQANEKFALVGESGQGKSTIVNLLLRYYQPQQGQILIGNQDISQVTQDSLHKQIAVVFQDSLLFSGTIMENILYGTPEATEEQAIAAAKAANAEEFIAKLPNGYQSIIGERGVKLSGGQKQRLSIARAMLKNAPIIILDEATSALDSKSELLVQEGLERLLRNRTAIIIAHRLSTIANADHILVIAEGKIAQYGSANQLIKDKHGLYAQLVKLQQRVATGKNKTPEELEPELKKFDLVG
jgi:ATP-binding cassette subfamily B protein